MSRFAPLFALLVLTVTADAGKRRRPPEPPPPVEEPPPPPPPEPVAAPNPFDAPLPWTVGEVPAGLANLSAQGCAACHVDSHASWQGGAHHTGWQSDLFRTAVAEVGTPACARCHLPLDVQHAELTAYDESDVNRPISSPNPLYRATLHTEGVSCVACHVRDGVVLTTTKFPANAPHPLMWSPDLEQDEQTCGSCHQLDDDAVNLPLYNTVAEWKQSPWGQAGVGCRDCHGGPAAGQGQAGYRHGPPSGEGLSVLVDVNPPALTRGAPPVPVQITLQNTGAGHHLPSSSPWTRWVLTAKLIGPPDRRGQPTEQSVYVENFGRTLSPEAPWNTVSDTRIASGEARVLSWPVSIEQTAPPGRWSMVLTLHEALGETASPAFYEWTLPMNVD